MCMIKRSRMYFPNGCEHCSVFADLQTIHHDIKTVHNSIESHVRDEHRRRRTRDKLAYQLEELQDVVQEALSSRENSAFDPDDMSLREKLEHFLDWRNELQVMHSSIGRSLAIARRMRGNRRGDIEDMKEIHDDITDYLHDTDYLYDKAREKLNEMTRRPQPRSHPTYQSSGRDSGYQTPRPSSTSRIHDLRSIVNDAEKIKKGSMESSLRMENEVERLRTKSIDMAKDLVALHKVIDRQKQELVELTRMKRSNERAERDLDDYYKYY